MDEVLKNMTLEFFGTGSHKISADKMLEKENAVFLDLRSREEAETISISLKHHAGIIAKHIPINELSHRLAELPRDKFIGVFCPANVRSTMAYVYLLSKGFTQVRIVEGGYAGLTEAILPGKVWTQVQSKKIG
ncbi:MAG: rhodanese-like domain-containing protein [Deltaproteobacteria bacterium]|nr:rhodanese-like domain-containing protein [Deltaproteobacteria bacterium]MBW2069856.1 rhodanese-like domain-containing protein [Deltaproteobacteria bacterium]